MRRWFPMMRRRNSVSLLINRENRGGAREKVCSFHYLCAEAILSFGAIAQRF